MIDQDLTEKERIANGRLAKSYLSDVNFLGFIERHKTNIRELIVETLPGETEQREKLYHMYRGIEDVIVLMQSEAAEGEAAEEADAAEGTAD